MTNQERERPKIENYSYRETNHLHTQKYVDDLNLYIDQEEANNKYLHTALKDRREICDKLEAEKKELIEELEQTISNLESKQKAFLGTNGETARANFKLGLGWAIEAFKTIVDNIK